MTSRTKNRLSHQDQFRLYGKIAEDREQLNGNPEGHNWASLAAYYSAEMGVVVPVSTMTTAVAASGIEFPVKRGGSSQTAMHRVVAAEQRLDRAEKMIAGLVEMVAGLSESCPDSCEQTAQAVSESSAWQDSAEGPAV